MATNVEATLTALPSRVEVALTTLPPVIDRIIRFSPVRLLVSDVGLFREPFSLDFVSEDGSPSNIFLLASPNGLGKTTLLETYASIFECLVGFNGEIRQESLNSGRGFAQLDIITDVEIDDRIVSLGLSLCCGRSTVAQDWSTIGLNPDLIASIEEYSIIHFQPSTSNISADELGRAVLRYFESGIDQQPSRLYDDDHLLPTMLFFPATRRIIRPPFGERAIIPPPDLRYRPLQVFEDDGTEWSTSLTNLLLWTYWLNDGRYRDLQALVEQSVLTDKDKMKSLDEINRSTLLPRIREHATGGLHHLDQLSHGERSRLQVLVRIAMHMTGSTFVSIDELELHLHPNWSLRLLRTLKNMAATRPISVIFTTHSPEIIRAFAHEEPEEGLRKGGHLIEHEEL